ncbi:MAG: hypothetical protein ACKO3N_16715, partial [Verrucomicrobiota bacterium]
MTFLPIVQRELMVTARNPLLGWTRFLAALAGLAVFSVVLALAKSSPTTLAETLFLALAIPLFAYSLLAGPLHTSDAITAELREETLGLLFLTDLHGYDVLLGKLVARSLQVFYAVVAVIPVLALPILLGTVTAGQFWRMTATLLTTLVLSLVTGLVASTVCREWRTAILVSLLALLGFTVGSALVNWLVSVARPGPGFSTLLPVGSPLGSFQLSFEDSYRTPGGPGRFLLSLQVQWLSIVVALFFAGGWLTRLVRRPAPVQAHAQPSHLEPAFNRFIGHGPDHWVSLRVRHPYAWLQRVFRPVPRLFSWSFGASLAAIGGLALLSVLARDPASQAAALWLALALTWGAHQWLKLQLAIAATRGAAEDRAAGIFELLIVSGVDPQNLVEGHRRGLLGQFAPAMLALGGLHVALVLRLLFPDTPESAQATLGLLVIGGLLLYVDAQALVLQGLRQALRQPGPLEAFRAAYLRVMAPGWVGLLVPALVLLTRPSQPGSIVFYLLLWLALSVLA